MSSFMTQALADSYRAELVRAARRDETGRTRALDCLTHSLRRATSTATKSSMALRRKHLQQRAGDAPHNHKKIMGRSRIKCSKQASGREKARMSLEATQEQRAAREVFASGADLTLVAGAGTGKTSTLMMMAEATSKHGLYMAFNKTTADDAQRRFSGNVECRTAHSIAFGAVGWKYKHRLNAPRLPARETTRLLVLQP